MQLASGPRLPRMNFLPRPSSGTIFLPNPSSKKIQVEFDIDDDNRAGKPRATKVTGGTGRREDMMSKGKGKGKDGMKGGRIQT